MYIYTLSFSLYVVCTTTSVVISLVVYSTATNRWPEGSMERRDESGNIEHAMCCSLGMIHSSEPSRFKRLWSRVFPGFII